MITETLTRRASTLTESLTRRSNTVADSLTLNSSIISDSFTTEFTISSGVLAPTAQPTSLTFSNVTSTTMDVSFTASVGGADGYVAFRRTGASPTFVPVDGTTYTVGNTYGDSTCQHFGAGVTFSETGLSVSTTYYYDIFAWNGAIGTYAFLTTSPLEGSQLIPYSFGNALHFDGTNDNVTFTQTAYIDGLSTLTLGIWIKFDIAPASTKIVLEKLAANKGIYIYFTATTFRVGIQNGSNTFLDYSTSGLTLTNWNYFGFVLDFSLAALQKLKVYFNLVQQAQQSISSPSVIGTSGVAMNLGRNSTFTPDGMIDELAIWSDANVSHLTNHYNSGSGADADATNLLKYLKFNGSGTSTVCTDETGYDNGTLVNFNFDTNDGWKTH